MSYVYLIFLALMLVWLAVNYPPTILMVLTFVFTVFIVIGLGSACIWVRDAWRNFLYDQRLQRLLGDMTIEEVLDQSLYEYGHVFQGDDGYRIWCKDAFHDFVQSGMGKKAAQMWIVEQYFKDDRNQEIS